jgi:hypothetical protein
MESGLDCATVAGAVADALKDVLGADGFDVLPDGTGAFVDIAADEWTLRIEGAPVTIAWLSIEDEPDDPIRLPAARRVVMPATIDNALAVADACLGGALAAALGASGDPLSLDLLASLTARDHVG